MGIFDRVFKKDNKKDSSNQEPKLNPQHEPEAKGRIVPGIMYLPPKIEKPPKDMTELDLLKNYERDLYYKMDRVEGYYGSEISKIEFKDLNRRKREYLDNNPKDFLTRGADLYPYLWIMLEETPAEKKEMYVLMGMGLYHEKNLEQYYKAIDYYKKANKLTWQYEGDRLREIIEEHGEGDYLDTAEQMARIRVCENKIFRKKVKKLEAEAKELEKINYREAIKRYEELNVLNPGLKKYNKRIEILKRKLE